jgi:hypothetical protein
VPERYGQRIGPKNRYELGVFGLEKIQENVRKEIKTGVLKAFVVGGLAVAFGLYIYKNVLR